MPIVDVLIGFVSGAIAGTVGDYFIKEPLRKRLDKLKLKEKIKETFEKNEWSENK